jgi:hypothetical protein
MVTQRSTTLSEAVDKYGKQHLEGLLTEFDYEGAIDEETGQFGTYEGKKLDNTRLDNLVDSYNTNPNSVIFRTADREAREDFDYETTSPVMLDEQGNQIPNPAFQQEMNKARSLRIKDEILRQADREYTKSGKRFAPSSATKESVEVTEVEEEDASFTTEDIPSVFKDKEGSFAGVAEDPTGKKYFKLKSPLFSYEGTVYPKEELPKGVASEDANEIPIGSWIDKAGNVKPDDSDLTETTVKKRQPAEEEYNVSKPGKSRVIKVKTYFTKDGKEVTVASGTALEGQMIGHVEVDGKPITQIKTKKGEIVQVPTTKSVKEAFRKEYEIIEEKKKEKRIKSLNGEKPNNKYGI